MSERPLRICMLTTFYPPYNFGGDGIYIQRLSQALTRRGHTVEVVHSIDPYIVLGGDATALPQTETHRVHRLRSAFPRVSSLLVHQTGRPIEHARAIKRILHTGRFDVLHFHNVSLLGGPGILGYGAAIKLYTAHEHWLVCPTHVLWKFDREPCTRKLCLACTLHSGRPPQLWRYTGLLPRMIQKLDTILFPSRFALERHRQEGIQGNLVRLPPFVPVLSEAERDLNTPPYFIAVARLEKIKGIQTLLPIFSRYSRAELWIAGAGDYEQELRRLAADNPRVKFLGRKTEHELRYLYRNALALIVPSLCYETFGIVILEAFAQGTPAIARRLGALTEVLEDSRGGYLYETDEELLATLARIQDHPQESADLGRAGKTALLSYWTEEPHMEQYLGLIGFLRRTRSGHKLEAPPVVGML